MAKFSRKYSCESGDVVYNGDQFFFVQELKPCYICKAQTHWRSIIFEGIALCSTDCAETNDKEFNEECTKIIASEGLLAITKYGMF